MKIALRLVLLISIGALVVFSENHLGYSQSTVSPQGSTGITGEALYKMIAQWTDRGRGLSYIAEIYSNRINKGIVPDKSTLNAFGEIFVLYMKNNREKWDKPVEELVVEALKDAPAQIEAQKAYWNNAYKVAEAYFAQPSPENAEKLYLALPEKRMPTLDYDSEARLSELIFDFWGAGRRKNFSTLDKNVDQGEPYAVDICYRLINISDGASTETLCYVLGALIPKHPRLFLQKVIAHEPSSLDHLDNMLMMVAELGAISEAGNDWKKYEEIYNARIALRIKALESVDDPELKEIRDRCLSILKKSGSLVII